MSPLDSLRSFYRSIPVLSFAAFALAAVACSPPPPGPSAPPATNVDGVVKGARLHAVHALSVYGPFASAATSNGRGDATGLRIVIADQANACASFHIPGATNLSFNIPGSPIAPGTYTVIHPDERTALAGEAEVEFVVTTATCATTLATAATYGTVTVTESDASRVAGGFDIFFNDGHVTGTFDASACGISGIGSPEMDCGR